MAGFCSSDYPSVSAVSVDPSPYPLLQDLIDKDLQDIRIELRSGILLKLRNHFRKAEVVPVSPVAGHGIVGVRDVDDPGLQRDLIRF
jgi:hypothetical protein